MVQVKIVVTEYYSSPFFQLVPSVPTRVATYRCPQLQSPKASWIAVRAQKQLICIRPPPRLGERMMRVEIVVTE